MTRRSEPSTNADGFEAIYRRELVPLIALTTTMTGSRELGFDLAHEALARAYRDWRTVGALDRPGAWVRRVAINLAIDAHRRVERETRALARLDRRPFTESSEGLADGFWAAVRTLPERQRVAIALHYIEDLSVAEIADILRVTSGTVKASLFAARRSLAVSLGTQEVNDDDD